jgi:hypothetical protein
MFKKLTIFALASSLVGMACVFPQSVYAESVAIDDIQGYYSVPSVNCTLSGRSCKKKFKDCLLVKKIDQKSAEVEIFSTQANQHLCGVKGVARVIDGKLVLYFDADAKRDEQHLELNKKGKDVILKLIIKDNEIIRNCGAHADFDGLIFKKTSDRPAGHQCFEG